MASGIPELLDADATALLLGVSRAMVERWARQGLLTPTAGSPSKPLFEANELRRWARQHGIQLHGSRGPAAVHGDFLACAIERGAVVEGHRFASAAEAISAATSALSARLGLTPEQLAELTERVLDRESMATTAMGRGVAVPHPREPRPDLVSKPHVAVLYVTPELDWAAPDRAPVHTALLLLSPNSREHLQVLSRVAFALRGAGFVDWLRERPSQAALTERLRGITRES